MNDEMIEFDMFCQFFKALTSFLGRRDADPQMLNMYYVSLERMRPTHEEVWNAIAQIIDSGNTSAGVPSASEFKNLIFQARGTGQAAPAIAAAQPLQLPEAKAGDRTAGNAEMRLAVLATIYKDQGDTPFYREMLKGGGIYSTIVGNAPVSHEAVVQAASSVKGRRVHAS